MADEEPQAIAEGEEPEETPGYKTPAMKSLDEIKTLDAEDESLNKYKNQLGLQDVYAPEDDPARVRVLKMALVVADRPDVELDLTGADLSTLKDKPFVIKEGVEYRMKIIFRCQHEIVTGLKYLQNTTRKGIPVDKTKVMVGSYPPRKDEHSYMTPVEEAPSGMVARGHYKVHSVFTDDDKNKYLEWNWAFDIKKDWE
ncbi:rho GDP-dissociation inhibitor 1-like [Branchiostoma floridae]|uniref:Rho GDP-dissociation inhibitor 3 n=1 Tax=Branchiostoma floridae TaxID=7739 RepID=A0A9J7M653_BRAFL|nr:rho GDP-dissociation inhibitor 1-like [Branchiostoma floridae]XP_035694869.1 rho GDP-dissociation inhibitor 1-like [Branchiostoma floridae]